MIRLRGERLRWDEADVAMMSRWLGMHAAKRQAPYLDSLAKLIIKRKLPIDRRLRIRYASDVLERETLRALHDALDAEPTSATERRLFAHQRSALAYLRAARPSSVLLTDSPGVGKTAVAIRWATTLVKATRALVVCPNAAKDQWIGEIERWTPRWARDLPITVLDGTAADQVARAHAPRGWVIAHWEALVHARLGLLARSWDVAILDEGHHIGNRDAQRTETAHSLDAEYRAVLTAHPYTNGVDELWSILRFLYPDRYTSFWRFMAMHVEVAPKFFGGFTIVGPLRPKLLRWELRPFTLRRTKRQVFRSLPPLTRVRRTLTLTSRGRREYDRLRKEFFAELAGHDDVKDVLVIPSVLARVTRLRQYLIDPGLLGAREPSVKYPAIRDWLDELDGPPVIFTMYREAALRLQRFLGSTKSRKLTKVLHGGMAGKVTQLKREFRSGALDALIIVIKAGGASLNFGGRGYVGHLDLPWTPRDLEQAEGRVDRPEEGTGRLVPTTSVRFIVTNSYEEKMEKKLSGKHGQFRSVFTADGLRELFA